MTTQTTEPRMELEQHLHMYRQMAKIRAFEEQDVPVDAYGVGSSGIRGANDYTADIVMTDGEPSAKVGRRLRPNERLERVT